MHRNRGFSLIELLIVVAIIMIIAAIAVPGFLRAKISANETSAISSVRSITTAQIAYKITYPEIGYAASLDQLGPPSNAPASSTQADLLDIRLTAPPYQDTGYTFSSAGNMSSFTVSAVPMVPAYSGVRSFCTDTPSVIYYSPSETGCVPATSPPI